jgi:hypothetical protein
VPKFDRNLSEQASLLFQNVVSARPPSLYGSVFSSCEHDILAREEAEAAHQFRPMAAREPNDRVFVQSPALSLFGEMYHPKHLLTADVLASPLTDCAWRQWDLLLGSGPYYGLYATRLGEYVGHILAAEHLPDVSEVERR